MNELIKFYESRHGSAPYVSLRTAQDREIIDVGGLPLVLRLLAENLLRADLRMGEEDLQQVRVLSASGGDERHELEIWPTRLILQDHSGVPVLADLASLRTLMAKRGLDPSQARPAVPVDLVVDHSVEVESQGQANSLMINAKRELRLNRERFRFLRWAEHAIDELRVVPPGSGIVHQMNLEHLARVVMLDSSGWLAPDFVLGTDSHTPMINSLGVLGWGVGGIEAETALLGFPVSVLKPMVVGMELKGALRPGVSATDLALTMTQVLREAAVVGDFVEFFGDGLDALPVTTRATVANMAPEYGCTVAYFPFDAQTARYLRSTARKSADVEMIEWYYNEQSLVRLAASEHRLLAYSRRLTLDLATVERSVSGPRRPQERMSLSRVPASFHEVLHDADPLLPDGIGDGSIAIAAITSCTNTSNPESVITAGLIARNAVRRGLTVPPWVKTSLAPGSRVVSQYLDDAGLLSELEQMGFHVVGYGCTTCIGNSGALLPMAAQAVASDNVRMVAVLSGNRNFEGRIHSDVSASYLASPGLVVAFAIAGTVLRDLSSEYVGMDSSGCAVFLDELWPSADEVEAVVSTIGIDQFESERSRLFMGDADWNAIDFPEGQLYDWPTGSTYLAPSPFFDENDSSGNRDIIGARVLVLTGDATTTDHLSPAGAIASESEAARYLRKLGVKDDDFNTYGCRRGNHEVLVRGTFANTKFVNLLTPGSAGAWTVDFVSGEVVSIYEAAQRYRALHTPLVVIAGKDYGFGSSRDWAAKGPALLGVKAVLAESFERIHRSNLIGMGILPLQFVDGDNRVALGINGDEIIDLIGVEEMAPGGLVSVRATTADRSIEWKMLARIDTTSELRYFSAGGYLRAAAQAYGMGTLAEVVS